METLILSNASDEDIKLLLAIAKKMGIDLRVADKQGLVMSQAERLNKSVQANSISLSEIVESCSSVRKARYEKRKKDNP
ncbi:hypothetical protein [Pleomorphovibrio marinus]|uniref:hypothetical protein n=1 Tax=Pleomorphovibrio marinus TaxID=2164132 RepID=UPI000E0AD3B6|nr:hypothetical protein [Pleomorphovibrio marinus]